jgi:DNA polymerase III subunit epsilon
VASGFHRHPERSEGAEPRAHIGSSLPSVVARQPRYHPALAQVEQPFDRLLSGAAALLSGGPQSAAAIAEASLGAPPGSGAAWTALVNRTLAAADRFVRLDDGRWSLKPAAATGDCAAGTLPDELVAIHVETTGGRSERERLVWIGVTRLSGGRIEDTYETFVNPERRVPQHTCKRLRIEPDDLDTAPAAEDVLLPVRDLIGQRPVAGHAVQAQVSQLNYELLWNGLPALTGPLIDTQELAAARVPDLQRPTLASIARRLQVPMPSHPLAGVSRAIASVALALHRLVPVSARAAVTAACHTPAPIAAGSPALAPPLAWKRSLPTGAEALPELPGVYVFRDGGSTALYVGKATNLRARVAQHFTGAARAVRLDDGMLTRVSRVDHEPHETELDALLREAALIEALRPPYNTQRAAHSARTYVVLEPGPFPRPTTSRGPVAGSPDAEWFGPYRHTRAARETVRVLTDVFMLRPCRRALPAARAKMRLPCLRLGRGLCPAPCAAAITPQRYAVLLSLARTFLHEGLQATLDAIDARLAAAADSRPTPEEEAWQRVALREVRSRLLRVRREHHPLPGVAGGSRLLMTYPGASGDAITYFVQDGTLIARRAGPLPDPGCPAPAAPPDPPCRAWPDPDPAISLTTSQRHVLLRWIQQHYGDPEVVPFD